MPMLSDLQLVYMGPRSSTELLKINTTKFQVEREPVYVKLVKFRGAKQGGVGGVSTPPEFWMGGLNTCQPPLILRKIFLGGLAPLKLI